MKRQLTDEQLDKLMRTLIDDAAPDEAAVDEIAGSPALWWGVQRQINAAKDAEVSPWPPIGKLWRRGWINLPNFAFAGAAAALLVVSFFILRPADFLPDIVVTAPDSEQVVAPSPSIARHDRSLRGPEIGTENKRAGAAAKTGSAIKRDLARPAAATAVKRTKEIKTDFIALSYARNAESGQIVRVRVPGSMMVTLGLVATVEKPSALVDAEVIVGDDGLTRAIRFIR